ncbi:MAG: hypothetical protein C3F18_12740 [Nitrosomonadales bacterium]|nr:MAG: hypothetical protein C3F18_12740 [Nitrosomonadales bacterium]
MMEILESSGATPQGFAAGPVFEDDAGLQEIVADALRLGEIPCFASFGTSGNLLLDLLSR